MCARGVWNEGASIKHHAIVLWDCLLWQLSTLISIFGPELSKSQVKKCLTFSSSVGCSWISCSLYRRAMFLYLRHVIALQWCYYDPYHWCKTIVQIWSYMHLPCICKPILSLNVCVFDAKPREKWIQFDLHIHIIFKNGLQNTQGSGTAPVWMPGWCDVIWVEILENDG